MNRSPIELFKSSKAVLGSAIHKLSSKIVCPVFSFSKPLFFCKTDAAHPESHNYASVGDLIPRMGSFNPQYLAIRRCFKEGLSLEEIISRLAFGDAIKDLITLMLESLKSMHKIALNTIKKNFNKSAM